MKLYAFILFLLGLNLLHQKPAQGQNIEFDPDSAYFSPPDFPLSFPLPIDFEYNESYNSCFQKSTGTSVMFNILPVTLENLRDNLTDTTSSNGSTRLLEITDTTFESNIALIIRSHEIISGNQLRKLACYIEIDGDTYKIVFAMPRYVPGNEERCMSIIQSINITEDLYSDPGVKSPYNIPDSLGIYFALKIGSSHYFTEDGKYPTQTTDSLTIRIDPSWGDVLVRDTIDYAFEKLRKALFYPEVGKNDLLKFFSNGNIGFQLENPDGRPLVKSAAIVFEENHYYLLSLMQKSDNSGNQSIFRNFYRTFLDN